MPMRQLFAIATLLILIFLCGALLSFPVYKLLQPLTDVRFHKLIPHVTSIVGLLVLALVLRHYQRLDRATLGYAQAGVAITQQMLAGFLGGIMIMLGLATVMVLLGIQQIESDLTFNLTAGAMIFVRALVTGLLVGLFEETLYRGALLGGLLAMMKPVAALLVSSGIYSAAHFLKFSEVSPDAPINWLTGLQILPDAFYRFSDPATLDAFLSLLAFGALLSLLRLKNRVIYPCIGLHAGVVTAVRIMNKTMDYVPGNNLAFMVNKYDHLLGYLTMLWLTACILIYYRYAFSGSDKPAS